MTNVADTWGINPQQFWLRGQRPEEPVRFDPETGMWNVYGYPETVRVLGDPATFSSDTLRVLPDSVMRGNKQMREGNLVQMDEPDHKKLRRLVSEAFTPKVVADLEPRIAALTHELLDAAAQRGRLELVADLAYPLPVIVIAELLGVPSSDRDLFKQWVDKMLEYSGQFSLVKQSAEQDRAIEIVFEQRRQLTEYLAAHATERSQRPREDLLTKLVQAEVDGERLTTNEVVNFATVLLIAGHITTTMLLGNTVLCLDAHREQMARVRADRRRLPGAIEESLRFLSPFAAVGRATTVETELGGARIPADKLLMVWIAAANRDERQFARPDEYDPTRDPNPHVAFGRGIHFCLGAPLARLEGRVALGILLDRFPELRVAPEGPEFIPSPNMTGVRKLPLLLAP
ncbi:cytochrome P450 [Nannocystis radixulma]|uniref:Cytochrome P450 n=1 Tax=Nannocystis radixulma TaxID=2995305 RepID=A0ABT5BN77_9BACT|nr:cytochrome P450 [Nannocystis radixulma]MDC0674391.1 cytochrome P450 [Nannocystis radixulma]